MSGRDDRRGPLALLRQLGKRWRRSCPSPGVWKAVATVCGPAPPPLEARRDSPTDESLDRLLESSRQTRLRTAKAVVDARAQIGRRDSGSSIDRLHKAIERDEFELFHQPKLDLRTGVPVGLEALIRWRRPGYGLLSPSAFIPDAEANGGILELGAWALRRACRHAAALPVRHGAPLGVAVNVSAVQLGRPDFEHIVQRALDDAGLAPDRLELELTESVLLDATPSITASISRLRDLGVGIAIDDFGTGYASLAYLSRFKVDRVKIDQSFVRSLTPGSEQAVVCESIVTMAHRMGLGVVAEGIETPEQLAFLIGVGCDVGQGYLFARPMPFQALGDFLARESTLADRDWIRRYAALLERDDELSVPAARGSSATVLPSWTRRAPRVLIIDDDAMNGVLLTHILRQTGIEDTHHVRDPRKAEAAFLALRPDLVLLDVVMPEVGGFEVLKRLRDQQRLHQCPVVLVTADFDAQTSTRAFTAGVSDLIHRPFDPKAVMLRIGNVLELGMLRGRIARLERHERTVARDRATGDTGPPSAGPEPSTLSQRIATAATRPPPSTPRPDSPPD